MTKFLKAAGATLARVIETAALPDGVRADLEKAARDKASPLPVAVRFAAILRQAEARARGRAVASMRALRNVATCEAAALGWVA